MADILDRLETALQDRYTIEREIGRGGMSIVYRGYDENLRVDVVIKENSFASLETGRQFKREARLLASLRHPVSEMRSDQRGQVLGLGRQCLQEQSGSR